MEPKISVLMGVYNCAGTLEEAVDCIMNQTYTSWELIMCDDGSTDSTYEVAAALAEKDNRIKVIKNDRNLTLAPTLNKCLEYAHGEYIARMDGDDICAFDRFALEIDFLNNNPDYVLVSCQMEMFDKDGVFRVTKNPATPQKESLVIDNPFCHAGCMMRTSVLRELNGYNADAVNERIEDYDLWYRLYQAGYKGANLDTVLYSMRDDMPAKKRRKYRYRINEYKLKRRIIKGFNLPWYKICYALRPLLVGLLPGFIYSQLHRNRKGI